MPLGKIVPLERSPEEQRIWEWVSKLVYPNDKEILKRLPRYHFRVWLAAIDARAALIATDYQEFYDLLRYQNKKRWYHEIVDSLWRLVYDRKTSH